MDSSAATVAARLQQALESAQQAATTEQQNVVVMRKSAGAMAQQAPSTRQSVEGPCEMHSSEKEESATENEPHGDAAAAEHQSSSRRHTRSGKDHHHHVANAVLWIESIEFMDPSNPAGNESPPGAHMHRTPSFARKLSILGDPASAAAAAAAASTASAIVHDFSVVCKLDMCRAKSTLFKFNPTQDLADEMSTNLVENKLLPGPYSSSFTYAIDQIKAKFAPLSTLPREQLPAALEALREELTGKNFRLHRVSPKDSEAKSLSQQSESESTCSEVHAPNSLDVTSNSTSNAPSRLGTLRAQRQQQRQADSALAPSLSEFDSSQGTSISRKKLSVATSDSSAEQSMSSSVLEPDEGESVEELATTPQPNNFLNIPSYYMHHMARDRLMPDRLSIRDIDFEKQLREVFSASTMAPDELRIATDKQLGELRHPTTLTDATQIRQELIASANARDNISLSELARRKSSVPANLICGFNLEGNEDSECSSLQSPTSPPATQESSTSNASSMPQTRSHSVGSRPPQASLLAASEQEDEGLGVCTGNPPLEVAFCTTAPTATSSAQAVWALDGSAPSDGQVAFAHQNSQHSIEQSTDSSTHTILRTVDCVPAPAPTKAPAATATPTSSNNLSPQSTRLSRSTQTEPTCKPCLPFNYMEIDPLGDQSLNQFPLCICTLFISPANRNLPYVKEVRSPF